ncbi:hypothetical protein D9611_006097 [Ephemerocybe angulata]|uniref:Fungal-type protein kinase domain-containing protein n=1 Tax=Ephemerocybe angulata TaxID=980116 RepID=A0A8H5CH51_9AGAR|nr:hypothetical protein D9611_006097 [Tulosesus angulatus]
MPVSPDPDVGSGVRTRAQARLAATVAQASAQSDIGESQEGAGATSTVTKKPRTRKKSSAKRKAAAKKAQANADAVHEPPAQESQSTVSDEEDDFDTGAAATPTLDESPETAQSAGSEQPPALTTTPRRAQSTHTSSYEENGSGAAHAEPRTPNTNQRDRSAPLAQDGTATTTAPKSKLRQSQEEFEETVNATPLVPSAQTVVGSNDEQRKTALEELGIVPEVDSSFLKGLYRSLATDKAIKEFLASTSLYDTKEERWTDIPKTPRKESELYAPFHKIITAIAIVEGLGKAGDTREVVDTHAVSFQHRDNLSHTSKPDVAIVATGPSFQLPQGFNGPKPEGVGYSNVASVWDIKLCASREGEDKQLGQLTVYNSGAFKTKTLDIHENPYTFVRLILGLSSKEGMLGLDTSVRWTVVDGVKVSGTISTIDGKGKRVKYDLIMNEPPFVRHTVRSRGTTCWNAKDNEGARVLIKDVWRADGRKPEHEFLKKAVGIEGLAQMISHEDNRAQTRDYRPKKFSSDDFYNRTSARITMKQYGPNLAYFSSQKQAIAAIRDAIKAHCRLLEAGVLHRDISMTNILLSDSESGSNEPQGILIDLDMAIVPRGKWAIFAPEGRTGTRLFQSLAMLKGLTKEKLAALAQDYLDDLESFFYVLCALIYGFDGIQNSQSPIDSAGQLMLETWKNPDIGFAYSSKSAYVTSSNTGTVDPPAFWSVPCLNLCNELQAYLAPLAQEKHRIRQLKGRDVRKRELSNLYDNIDKHYADIVALFESAVTELSKPGGDASRRSPSLSPPPTPCPEGLLTGRITTLAPNKARKTSKRASDHVGDSEDAPASKRRRSRRH